MASLFRNRDYLGWWIGESVSEFGSALSTVAYPLLILVETGSAARAGVVGAAVSVGVLVTLLFGGALADRYSRRTILMAGPMLQAIAVATIVVAVLTDHVWLWHVAVVGGMQGAISGLTAGAEGPALRRIVPSAQLPDAFAQMNGRGMAIRLIGPSTGGVLFGLARWIPFAGDAISFLASTLGVALIRTPLGPDVDLDTNESRQSIFASIGEGLRYVRGNAYMRFTAVWVSLMNMCATGVFLLVVVLIHNRGGSPAQIGAASSVGAAGGIVGAILCRRIMKHLHGRSVVLIVGWLVALAFVGIALSPNPWLIGASLAAMMLFIVPINVVFSTYETRIVPDALLGRVSSALDFGSSALRWVGPLGTGLIATAWSATGAGLVLAGIVTALAVSAHLTSGLDGLDEPMLAEAPVDQVAPAG